MNKVTIIICTRDRADSLAGTLEAILGGLRSDAGCFELIVVDNGSTDETAEVVRCICEKEVQVRYLFEPRGGQAVARNRALAEATGDVIVFTDDDIRPERQWLTNLVTPILSQTADAVVGRVCLAPYLERPWMTPTHRAWLACTEAISPEQPSRMVGANMAFSREVLEKVASFDEELGPGALGFADDTLFSAQLLRAGFRLMYAHEASVIHHCDQSRLSSEWYRSIATKMGRSDAYVAYHWNHASIDHLLLRSLRKSLQVTWAVSVHSTEALRSTDNLLLFHNAAYFKALLAYRGTLRKYGFKGLSKLDSQSPSLTQVTASAEIQLQATRGTAAQQRSNLSGFGVS